MFRKPSKKKSGLKVISYGKEGTGKTIFALSFPSVAIIDSENGATFYEGTERGKNIKLVANTQSYKELDEALDFIEDVYDEEGIETLVTDSLTKIRQNLSDAVLNVDIKRNRRSGMADADLNSNISIRSWGTIGTISKRQSNRKIDLSTNINIVDIAQLKEIKDDNGDVVDQVPDVDKSAPYDYDIKLRHYTESDGKGGVRFLALVEKDRTETYKTGTVLENPSFENWKTALERVSDGEELKTSYSDQAEKSAKAYEEEVEEESKTTKEKVVDIGKALSDADRKAMMADIKSEEINVAKLDKLTKSEMEKIDKILDEYRKKIEG